MRYEAVKARLICGVFLVVVLRLLLTCCSFDAFEAQQMCLSVSYHLSSLRSVRFRMRAQVALLEGGREALSRLLEVVGSLAGNANAEGLETEAEAAEAALDAAVMLLEEVSETAALENWGPQVSPDKAAGAVATSTSTSAVELDDGKMAELQARAEAAEARTKEFEAQLTQTKAKTEAALKERNEAVARAEAAEATLVKAEARAEVAEAHMHRAETRAEAAEAKITLSDANSETAADEHTARQKEVSLRLRYVCVRQHFYVYRA